MFQLKLGDIVGVLLKNPVFVFGVDAGADLKFIVFSVIAILVTSPSSSHTQCFVCFGN